MTKTEFYATIDEILEAAPGTIKGDERLKDLEAWDSLAVVSFIALMHASLQHTVAASKVKESRTVQDLLALVADKLVG